MKEPWNRELASTLTEPWNLPRVSTFIIDAPLAERLACVSSESKSNAGCALLRANGISLPLFTADNSERYSAFVGLFIQFRSSRESNLSRLARDLFNVRSRRRKFHFCQTTIVNLLQS